MFIFYIYICILYLFFSRRIKKGPRRVLNKYKYQKRDKITITQSRTFVLSLQNFRSDIICIPLLSKILAHAFGVLPFTKTSTLNLPVFILFGEVSVTVVVDGSLEALNLLKIILGVDAVCEGSQLNRVADFGVRFGLEVLFDFLCGLEPETQDGIHGTKPGNGGVGVESHAGPFEIRTTTTIEISGPLSGGEDVQNEVLELGESDLGTGDHEEQSPAEIELRVPTSPTQAGPIGGIVNITGLVVHPLVLGDELGIDCDVTLPVLASIKGSRSQIALLGEAHADVPRRLRLGDDLAVALEVPDTAPGGGPKETGVQEYVRIPHQPTHLVRA